jgi:hypothetical protein
VAVVVHRTQTLTVEFSSIPKRGWGAATKLVARDLWKKADLSPQPAGSFKADVPPHGTVMLKLSPPTTEQ